MAHLFPIFVLAFLRVVFTHLQEYALPILLTLVLAGWGVFLWRWLNQSERKPSSRQHSEKIDSDD
jgi:hypothetical protein